jgi:hypothetical protein
LKNFANCSNCIGDTKLTIKLVEDLQDEVSIILRFWEDYAQGPCIPSKPSVRKDLG